MRITVKNRHVFQSKKLIYVLFLFLNLGLGNNIWAQSRLIEKADELFKSEYYHKALNYYLRTPKLEEKGGILVKIALCYARMHQTEKAVTYFDQARNLNTKFRDEELLEYGHVLRQKQNYHCAKEIYSTIRPKPENFIKSCDWAIEDENPFYPVKVDSLSLRTDEYINGLMVLNNGVLYARKNSTGQFQLVEGDPIKGVDSVWMAVDDFPWNLNSPTFSLTDSMIYYSGNVSKRIFSKKKNQKKYRISKKGRNNLYIWSKSLLDPSQKAFELAVNHPEYSCSHPFVTPDGKRLYFVSNKPGGFGGFDIYYMDRIENGWDIPINMGPKVNTQYNESFPFVSGDYLFFSSNGHPGYGGSDVFSFDLTNLEKEVLNLGKPINSPFDDFSYVEIYEKEGFFVSNRNRSMARDIIYAFRRIPPIMEVQDSAYLNNQKYIKKEVLPQLVDKSVFIPLQSLNGSNVNNDGTELSGIKFGVQTYMRKKGEPIDTEVNLLVQNKNPRILYSAINVSESTVDHELKDTLQLDVSENQIRIEETKTNDTLWVYQEKHDNFYKVTVFQEKYLGQLPLQIRSEDRLIRKTVYATKRSSSTYQLPILYFEFDKFELTSEAKHNLHKLFELLRAYPQLNVTLEGHTDCRGSAAYNLKLSVKRAQAAMKYLLDKSEVDYAVWYRGVGEEKSEVPIENCGKQPEKVHRANRRVEYHITLEK
ncbi:hypothetical protein DF185_16320 [Marinifilum breve]|uniref:OmpA-like domain-containing protein n=1 Tax=Marinifilum breve TaxID=2184082 RepID=A0A2V3ZV47_9BACT|nr:OmpA family protein [Marinifilum breve]PXX98936.1 hypothetical protein DF185_16320 [Marinifilum breve]